MTPVGTLADLHKVKPDVAEVKVDQGLDQAMLQYRRFLEDAPENAMTPEAMRRLADLQLEKQFGIHNADARPREFEAPQPALALTDTSNLERNMSTGTASRESDGISSGAPPARTQPRQPATTVKRSQGPLEAIALYDKLLTEYPNYEQRDKVLYQQARAYDELGRTDEAIATMERLIKDDPKSSTSTKCSSDAASTSSRATFPRRRAAYTAITDLGSKDSYYELALYKLGWTLYKQEFYEEALQKYMALLDYKLSIGYDFDQTHEEDDDRRVADTFRVISLSFSNLGGPETMQEYFSKYGSRSYEDRIYNNLGEHYLEQAALRRRGEDVQDVHRA